MSKFIKNLDFWGFLASFLCAIHCAAVPLILLFGSLGSFAWLANHEVELVFIGISIVFAYWSLWTSYKRHHKQRKAVNIALYGFGFLVISRLVPHHIGDVLVVKGGCLIAYAHYINWRLLQNCKHCTHSEDHLIPSQKDSNQVEMNQLQLEEVF